MLVVVQILTCSLVGENADLRCLRW